jgi:hypothetical protein
MIYEECTPCNNCIPPQSSPVVYSRCHLQESLIIVSDQNIEVTVLMLQIWGSCSSVAKHSSLCECDTMSLGE